MTQVSRRFISICVLVFLSLPALYFTVKYGHAYLNNPELYEGDRLETRTCRQCGGKGKDPQLARELPMMGDRCPFCRGKGKVDVVLPGPHRPTRIWGAVVDVRRAGDVNMEVLFHLRQLPNPFPNGRSAGIPGAIRNAMLTFHPHQGEDITIQTGDEGRFSKRIPPGLYTLKITAPFYESVEGEIEVKPLVEPIWMEKANLIEPGGSQDLSLLAGLSRDRDEEGFIRMIAGWP